MTTTYTNLINQMTNDQMTKIYILKPGRHQFAPGEPAMHHNDNLTDKEARWYLKAYLHIKNLFTSSPAIKRALKKQSVQPSKISETQS
ncbi:hypothetical protein [Mucilaginibacter antarcticus]|uniref:Uncharacterized protein n=1 Tax=Mucilaginibacter antarcticus TaxID=1855725 RepID=A0ABW5XS05_9SPHI